MTVVGIVGLGQIGGSLAKGLIQEKIPVIGLDIDYATRRAAETSGIAIAKSLAEVVKNASVIFCCVSISANRATVESLLRISGALSCAPTISDVASYKSGVLPEAMGRDQLIPGHPMAGSHGYGFGSATAALFKGAVWNLVIDEGTVCERLVELVEVITLVGSGVHLCSREWHDETVSLVSGLPHALALSLGSVASEFGHAGDRLALAAGSFKSATRVLLSDPRFFSDLLSYNRPTLLPLIELFRAKLNMLEEILRNDDREGLDRILAGARGEVEPLYKEDWNRTKTEIPVSQIGEFVLDIRDKGWIIYQIAKSTESFHIELKHRGTEGA